MTQAEQHHVTYHDTNLLLSLPLKPKSLKSPNFTVLKVFLEKP